MKFLTRNNQGSLQLMTFILCNIVIVLSSCESSEEREKKELIITILRDKKQPDGSAYKESDLKGKKVAELRNIKTKPAEITLATSTQPVSETAIKNEEDDGGGDDDEDDGGEDDESKENKIAYTTNALNSLKAGILNNPQKTLSLTDYTKYVKLSQEPNLSTADLANIKSIKKKISLQEPTPDQLKRFNELKSLLEANGTETPLSQDEYMKLSQMHTQKTSPEVNKYIKSVDIKLKVPVFKSLLEALKVPIPINEVRGNEDAGKLKNASTAAEKERKGLLKVIATAKAKTRFQAATFQSVKYTINKNIKLDKIETKFNSLKSSIDTLLKVAEENANHAISGRSNITKQTEKYREIKTQFDVEKKTINDYLMYKKSIK